MARKLAFFAAAAALSTLAAWWRWPDSAHAMGTIRRGGGAARHPVTFREGPSRYGLVATATVLPPYHGDVRIALEGEPPLEWSMELSRPAVDLGLHRWPRLDGDVLRGLEPRERIALWISLRPPVEWDPVCGMPCGRGAPREDGRCFCSAACRDEFRARPPAHPAGLRASYRLAFRDVASGAPVLTIPISFGARGGASHAGAHH
jgi:hypothetical protein